MKLLLKIITGITLLLIVMVAIVQLKPDLVASLIQRVAERYLSNAHIVTQVGEVQISKESAIFKDIIIRQDQIQIATIESAELSYSLGKIIRKMIFSCNLKITNFNMDDMKFSLVGALTYGKSLQKIENIKVKFVDGGLLELSGAYKKFLGKPYAIVAQGKATDLPVMLHKAFWTIAPKNGVVVFLKEYINHGYISGQWDVNLDRSFFGDYKITPDNLSGSFKLTDLALKYDEEFPPLRHINADAAISGTNLEFDISQGYSGGIVINEGRVTLNWEKGIDSAVMISAKGKGPALDLISFIPKDAVDKLQKSSIDLKKISGQMTVDFGMTAPIDPSIPNTYDAKANITNVNLKVLDDNVELSQASLKGAFDGKMVRIDGKGKVNGFDSDLGYQFNFDNTAEFENLLDVKLKFTPLSDRKQSNLSAISGQSIVNMSYKSKGDNGSFVANSNLKDVAFFVEKLGIYKERGEKAIMQIDSSGQGMMPSIINIKVTGDNSLKILGSFSLLQKQKQKKLVLSQVRNFDTDLKADLTFGDHFLKANISGQKLDLSRANMMNFLSKNADSQNTDLDVQIARIKIKNDVQLDDFVMKIRCDRQKCYDGSMNSKIGTQSFTMNLNNEGAKEEWRVSSTNAGALMKGLGMYDNVKAGNLMLVVGASRQEAKAGEQINIIKGRFTLQKFVTTKTPMLTRMVSFISFPGLMSSFSKNQNIAFKEMQGIFSYKDNKITIEDASAEGAFFDFTMKGSIDTAERVAQLKGQVTPSFFGVNTIAGNIPIIGRILSGGHRKGLISAPYFVKTSY